MKSLIQVKNLLLSVFTPREFRVFIFWRGRKAIVVPSPQKKKKLRSLGRGPLGLGKFGQGPRPVLGLAAW